MNHNHRGGGERSFCNHKHVQIVVDRQHIKYVHYRMIVSHPPIYINIYINRRRLFL